MKATKAVAFIQKEPWLIPALILLATIWLIPHTPILTIIDQEFQRQYDRLPAFKFDAHPSKTALEHHANDRAVLYIETRKEITVSTPLLLHMTQVVPPEWRFLFIGTTEIIEKVNSSSPIRRMVDTGKLRLQNIDRFSGGWGRDLPAITEVYSRLLTNLTFYDEQLPKVENLLVFRSNSIICANANKTVNDYLDYDWVGAPWSQKDKFGGNGGLSLRKVSKVREVLSFQERIVNGDSEDKWMSKRISLLSDAKHANATIASTFAVEDIWYSKPLGYHIHPGLNADNGKDVWAQRSRRKEIFDYCPEIKIILSMKLNREKCIAD